MGFFFFLKNVIDDNLTKFDDRQKRSQERRLDIVLKMGEHSETLKWEILGQIYHKNPTSIIPSMSYIQGRRGMKWNEELDGEKE